MKAKASLSDVVVIFISKNTFKYSLQKRSWNDSYDTNTILAYHVLEQMVQKIKLFISLMKCTDIMFQLMAK